MNDVHDKLVARFMVSLQRRELPLARQLASCVLADLGLGVVLVARDAEWNGTGLSWKVPGIAELAVRHADKTVGVALFGRQLSPGEARHLAAQLIDAAHEAEVGPIWEARRARMSEYRPRPKAAEPTDLLDLLGAQ